MATPFLPDFDRDSEGLQLLSTSDSALGVVTLGTNITTANLTNSNSSEMADDSSEVAFDNLYRVILQCFVIIIFGYIAGRIGVVSPNQASGLGTFVSKFTLPALLLKNMIELDFSQVNWMFLVGILIAKGSLFILVIGVTLLVKHPINLGYAGIFAIFATQSNDFAVGYPILEALYGKSHKDYLNYLYLVAPISLVVLNPIGFILLEIHKNQSHQSSDDGPRSDFWPAMQRVAKGIFSNPIVVMTFVGIIGHFIFHGVVPTVLDDVLILLGNAFNATALFLLGLCMVGKFKGNMGLTLLLPMLLVAAKTLILPLIIWEVVGSLVESQNGTTSLSMYGFIYGTFPAAPSVFLYATYYNIAEDVVAKGTVLGTFLSAPLMFASAKMMTMGVTNERDHSEGVNETCFDISIVSLVCSVWVVVVFIIGRKYRLVPHRFTLALIISQILACIGMMTYYTHGRHNANAVEHYPIIILLLVGVFAARVWTAILSVVMYLLHVRSLCFILRHQFWIWFCGFGIPTLLTGVIFMLGRHDLTDEVDLSFHFGKLQTILSATLLCVCIVVTITSILLWQRIERQQSASPKIIKTTHGSFDDCDHLESSSTNSSTSAQSRRLLDHDELEEDGANGYQTGGRAPSIEDLIPFKESKDNHHVTASILNKAIDNEDITPDNITERTCLLGQCNAEERHQCIQNVRTYVAQNVVDEEDRSMQFDVQGPVKLQEEYQNSHHLILLLVLLFSMFVGLILCIWRLIHSQISGIYLEMEFLDSFLNYGQGFILFAVFGFDAKLVFSPIVRRFRRWLASSEVLGLPKSSQLDKTTRNICHQFVQYHKDNCGKEIVRDVRNVIERCESIQSPYSTSRVHKNVFTGTALCEWLIEAGLAEDKESAVTYGRHLLVGRVIVHAMGQHHFQDTPHYYRFVTHRGNSNC